MAALVFLLGRGGVGENVLVGGEELGGDASLVGAGVGTAALGGEGYVCTLWGRVC